MFDSCQKSIAVYSTFCKLRVSLYGKNGEGGKCRRHCPQPDTISVQSVWRQQGKVSPRSCEVHIRNSQSLVWDFAHLLLPLLIFLSRVEGHVGCPGYTLLNDLPVEITVQMSDLQVPISCLVLSCLLSYLFFDFS